MIKKGIVSLVCCLFVISFLPVRVFADVYGTYIPVTVGERYTFWKRANEEYFNYGRVTSGDGEIRAITICEGENLTGPATTYFVSTAHFTYRFFGSTEGTNNNSSRGYRFNDTFYAMGESTTLGGYPYTAVEVPVVHDTRSNERAWYYTFGPGAEEPVEPVNYGLLRDVRYDTSVAGNGLASSNNIDYLSWNKFIDTNNNDISAMHVEVQAVPGYWRGSDYQDYISKKYSEFDNGSLSPVSLGSISVSLGGFSVSWNAVYSKFGFSNYDIYASLKGAVWESIGWYYQIRLVTDDGYVGGWQTIYNVTSASSEGIQNIVNHNEFNSTTNSYLQTITQINSQETVNITYNDTTITIENPDANSEPEGGTNLWDVLKQLVNGLFQLLAKLGDIAKAVINFVGDLLDGLLDFVQNLITPPETISNEYNTEINNNVNNYIEQSQPGLNDTHEIIINAKDTLEGISSNAGNDCILTWEDVKLDLSVFGAGNVVFIPGGTYDFKASFNSLLTGAGLSYETYQMLVSAVIYICLIYLISRKITGFLHKS